MNDGMAKQEGRISNTVARAIETDAVADTGTA
jgi:hypothetical protein